MKQSAKDNGRVKQLFNGQWVRVSGVSPALVDQVQASVEDPPVPIVTLDDGSMVENPTDPAYLRELTKAEDLRQRRALHAIVLFGIELADEEGNPVDPPEDGWDKKLRRVGVDWKKEMLKIMGREEFFDQEDEDQARREAYTLLVAWSGHKNDLELVMSLAGQGAFAQQKAEDMFQRPS